jgi:hypothetical protein
MTLGATYKKDIGIDYDKSTYVYRFSKGAESLKDTINDIINIINQDRLDIYVRQKATEIIKDAGVKDRDTLGIIKAIYNYLQDNVAYVEDPKDVEFMQRTRRLLGKTKAGDCDDFTIAGASLLLSLNIDVKLKVVGTESTSYFNHIYLLVKHNSDWIAFDPIYKHRKLGQEPNIIKTSKIFDISPISSMYNGNSLAVILNGDKPMTNSNSKLYNDLGFYNNALNTISNKCKQIISTELKGDVYNTDYKEAIEFFDYNSKPRIVNTKEIPEFVKDNVRKDTDIERKYKQQNLDFNTISNNPVLMGFITAQMLDGYTNNLGFFKKLWSGVKNFFKKGGLKKIASGVKKIASNPLVQSATNLIPVVGPAISSGMKVASGIIPDFKKKPKPQRQPQRQIRQQKMPRWQGMANRVSRVMQNPYIQRATQQIPFMNNAFNFMRQGFSRFQNMFNRYRNFSGDKKFLTDLPLVNASLEPFIEEPQIIHKNLNGISKELIGRLPEKQLGRFTNMMSTFRKLTNPVRKKHISEIRKRANANDDDDDDNIRRQGKSKKIFELTKRANANDDDNIRRQEMPEKTVDDSLRRQENVLNDLINELYDILDIKPIRTRASEKRKTHILNELKGKILEDYIKIFLAWDLLDETERKKIKNELKEDWGITSSFVSKPPFWSDKVVELYEKHIADLNQKARKNRMRYEEIKRKLKNFLKRIVNLREDYNKLKKLQQEKYIKLTSGLGQDNNDDLQETIDKLEKQIKNQEEQAKNLINIQKSELVKLLVTQLINLYKKIIELWANKKVNKAVIEKLTEDVEKLENRLEDKISKIENLNKEVKDYINRLNQAKIHFKEQLKQKTDDFNEQKKEIIESYDTQLNEKKSKINELKKGLRVSKAMYKLLPESARQFIDEFESEGIDLKKANLDTIEKLYEKYAKIRLEIRDKFNEIKDKAIEIYKNLFLKIENNLSMTKTDLEIINSKLREYSNSNLNDRYEILEKRYSDLEKDFRKAKQNETFYIQSLYAGVKKLSKDTKNLLMRVINSSDTKESENNNNDKKENQKPNWESEFTLV